MKKLASFVAVSLAASLLLVGCASKDEDEGSKGSKTTPAPTSSYEPLLEIPGDHELLNFSEYTSPDRRVSDTHESDVEGIVDPPEGSGYDRYWDQEIDWEECGSKECATVLAPLDWTNPDGVALTLSVSRIESEAGDDAPSLFINPGGPGGSGLDYLDQFNDSPLLEKYHIVAWDPRGAGESTPVVCGTGEETDAFYNTDFSPDTEEEWVALEEASKAFADQCRENSGSLLDHISTIDTIQDLDMLRYLVGDEELNYLGVSYGTDLGSMYAEFYPQNVALMVLDSAVNITDNDAVIQAMGFELSLHNWAKWCAESDKCDLGTDEQEIVDKVDKFLKDLDENPIPVRKRALTQSLATTGLALTMYVGEEYYELIAEVMTASINDRDGDMLLGLADLMYDRKLNGSYGGLYYSFYSISCLDSVDKGIEGARDGWAEDIEKAPVFAFNSGVDMLCPVWTTEPMPQIKRVAKGAAPIIVLGVTGDSATPYQQAEWMAEQLESGVLVTLDGAGHGAYGSGNACIEEIVNDYFLKGVVPEHGTVCE